MSEDKFLKKNKTITWMRDKKLVDKWVIDNIDITSFPPAYTIVFPEDFVKRLRKNDNEEEKENNI